jgi:hypothetical protein
VTGGGDICKLLTDVGGGGSRGWTLQRHVVFEVNQRWQL